MCSVYFVKFSDIADTLCYLLVGPSENGASQGIEVGNAIIHLKHVVQLYIDYVL